MADRLQRLREIVDELEKELDSLESVDREAGELLREATIEIQDALRKKAPEQLEQDSLTEQFTQAAGSFEASHPTLAGLLERAVEALRQIGI